MQRAFLRAIQDSASAPEAHVCVVATPLWSVLISMLIKTRPRRCQEVRLWKTGKDKFWMKQSPDANTDQLKTEN
jgi:hypothetical protein